ncbi:MAG: MarR family transcriptional regulator [Candidatus Aquilonibacter sp.]
MAKTLRATSTLDTEAAIEELLQATWQLVRRLRSESNDDGLTWSQMVVLGQLKRHGPMTTAELARAESVKPQSMGATLAFLEEQGLVERRAHPSDGRQVLFALTKSAVSQGEARRRAKRRWLTSALAQLDPSEQRLLIAAIGPLKHLVNA